MDMGYLYWVGLALWAIGLGGLLSNSGFSKVSTWILWVLVIIGINVYGAGYENRGMEKGTTRFQESLTKEVSLQEVAVRGQNIFQAQIKIIYEDGQIQEVKLIPNTTTPQAVSVNE